MNTETFFQQFELLADAPNGIAKLRELILQLAVQGKLVPQNPDDESAAVLLERMKAKEIPFELPKNWLWIKFEDFFDIQGGTQPPKSKFINKPAEGYIRLFQIRDFGLNPVPVYVPKDSVRRLCTKNDVMIGRYGASVGKVFMGQDGAYNVALVKVVFESEFFLNRFVFFLLKSFRFQNYLKSLSRSAQAGFNKGNLSNFLLPLPPLAEQKRIVEQVDRLMELCDKLETQQQQQKAKTLQLGTAATSRLTAAKTSEAFKQHWQNISNNFDLIYSTPDNIKQLRQTILQLAVMGKLVPQNPDDEPASVLLAKIKAEKEKLIKEGAIKKSKKSKAIASDEIPFDLPEGWQWAKFDSVILEITSGWSPMCEKHPKKDDQWGVMKVSAVSWDRFNPNENKALPSHLEPRTQFEAQVGDFLMSRANTSELVGKSVIVDNTPRKLLLSDKILKVSFSRNVYPTFFNIVNNSLRTRSYYAQVSSGTSTSMRNISRIQILNMPIPLPPLAEQHRIVAKVSQLMTYCDELEAKLTQSLNEKQKLMDTAIYQLLTA